MGNRYYGHCRGYGKKRNGQKGTMAFFCGGLLVLVFAWGLFSSEEGTLKKVVNESADRVGAVCAEAVAWGKDKLGTDDTSFALPVSSGVVVEEFGVVTDADGKESYHKGIDIQVPAGSEALSAADGTVASIEAHSDGSYWVTVAHSQNWSTVYGRLGEVLVAEGDEVKKGDALGVPVNTILHFEVLEDNKEKDPVGSLEKGSDG